MLRNELSLAIDYLEASNEIKKMVQDLKGKCIDASNINNIIAEIEAKAKNAKTDRSNNKLPFYQIFLAYAYSLISNWAKSIHYAERAEAQFNMNGQKQNQAICLWMLGLLYCYYEQLEHAKSKIHEATGIISDLYDDIRRSGDYVIPNNAYQYQDIISDIDKSYSELKIQVLEQVSTKQNNPTLRFDFFSRIVALLLISQDEDFTYLVKWRDDIIYFEPSELPNDESFIDEILEQLDRIRNQIESALNHILLAHRYELGYYASGQQGQEAGNFSKKAKNLFEPGDVNHFLSCCYLNLLYYNHDIEGMGRSHLENACRLLDNVQEEYNRLGFKEYSKEIQDLQNDIRSWIFPFKFNYIDNQQIKSLAQEHKNLLPLARSSPRPLQQSTIQPKSTPKTSSEQKRGTLRRFIQSMQQINPSSHDKTPTIQGGFSVPLVRLAGQPPKIGSPNPPSDPPSQSSEENKESNIRHLIIPVDIRALEDSSVNIIPLEHELYEKLESLDNKKAHSNNNKQDIPTNKNNAQTTKRIIIPRFPIYGSASAGPNGEAQLLNSEGLERAEAVDEAFIIKFDGMGYKVNFIDSLSHTFAKNKTYGWFKVTGESMNKAGILGNDYVLFRENRSLEFCAKKIVIALLSDTDTQPPCLMVKRLVKMSGEIPCNDDGFGSEICKFVLHSESHLERDPKTGMSYKIDLEIQNDHQLIGDVIAVAKRT